MGKRTGKDSHRGKLTFPGLLGADESRQQAEQFIDAACRAVAASGLQATALEALAKYVLERNH